MRDRSSGFALVQLLASLVILGMISLLIFQGLSTGRRVWQGIDSGAAAVQSVQSAQSVLRAAFERSFPATRYDYGSPYVDFQGAAGTVTFLAPPPDVSQPQALRRYSLAVTAGGDLVLSSISDVAADYGAPIDQRVLMRGVQQLDIAYFGPARPDFTPRWRTTWTYQATLPELVRVRLSLAPGDRRLWPDLMINPQATVDSDCVLYQGKCRGR
jgi:general secretion pathway protein J